MPVGPDNFNPRKDGPLGPCAIPPRPEGQGFSRKKQMKIYDIQRTQAATYDSHELRWLDKGDLPEQAIDVAWDATYSVRRKYGDMAAHRPSAAASYRAQLSDDSWCYFVVSANGSGKFTLYGTRSSMRHAMYYACMWASHCWRHGTPQAAPPREVCAAGATHDSRDMRNMNLTTDADHIAGFVRGQSVPVEIPMRGLEDV